MTSNLAGIPLSGRPGLVQEMTMIWLRLCCLVGRPILAAAGFQPAFEPSVTCAPIRLNAGCGQNWLMPHSFCIGSAGGRSRRCSPTGKGRKNRRLRPPVLPDSARRDEKLSGIGQNWQPRQLSAFLVILMAAPLASAQQSGTPLKIAILEGNNAVNSISLARSVAPVVEIQDSNDFPVEGASVTFTLPAQGSGGVFPQGGNTFVTRSDARGQAIAPFIVPRGTGKFLISITATAGTRKGEASIAQTNATGAYIGPAIPPTAWYKKKSVWALAGGAAVAAIVVVVVTGGSKSTAAAAAPPTIVITPGSPVFH